MEQIDSERYQVERENLTYKLVTTYKYEGS